MDERAAIRTYGNTNLPKGTPSRPLVTFTVLAYNQEGYIQSAVEGAFSQTYSPLEIILSDDRSFDGTYCIMERMSKEYRGPHRVIVRQQLENKGILGHLLAVSRIASGDITVVSAGDDISLANRTEALTQRLLVSEAVSISSDDVIIDAHGNEQNWDPGRIQKRDQWFSKKQGWIHGATAAYRTSFLKQFPLPKENVSIEDEVISELVQFHNMRSERTHEKLVKYRYHADSISARISNFSDPKCLEESAMRQWRRQALVYRYCLEATNEEIQDANIRSVRDKWLLRSEFFEIASKWTSVGLQDRVLLLYFSLVTGNLGFGLARIFGERVFWKLKGIKKNLTMKPV